MILKPTHYAVIATLIGAVLFVTWQQVRIISLERELASVKEDRANEQAAYERASRQFAQAISTLKTEHAVAQQEQANVHTENFKRLERAAAAERARVVGLRQQLKAFTSADSRGGDTTDPAACQRDRADLEALGALAAEGAGLLEEARELLSWRDEELRYLRQQILLDREFVQKAHSPLSSSRLP